jgi:hypothetical protein
MTKFVIRDYNGKLYDSYFKQWVVFANSLKRAKELIGGDKPLDVYFSKTIKGTNKERILKYYENQGFKNNK